MADRWTDRLSDYVNGDVAPDERSALEAHLQECAGCRTAVAQVRQVVAWAHEYPGRPMERDAWPAIAEDIRAGAPAARTVRRGPLRPARRPRLLAAGIAVVAVAGGSWWLARWTAAPRDASLPAWTQSSGLSAESTVLLAQKYSAAIAQLEHVLLADSARLDTATVRIVRDKLTLMDRAIDEARAALAQDPNSDFLADHFAGMMRQKLALLRTVARS